jgi:hypothetical protein
MNKKLYKEFYEINELCNEFESKETLLKLSPEPETQYSSINTYPNYESFHQPIIMESQEKAKICCGYGCILY